jgi:hypothetical protein
MKTRAEKRRGAPANRRNPPRMVVSPPKKQKETPKLWQKWKGTKEARQVVFHAWMLLKHLWLLSYNMLRALCKLTFGLLIAHHERIVEITFLLINMDLEHRVHDFQSPHK